MLGLKVEVVLMSDLSGKILVIDDSHLDRQRVIDALSDLGYPIEIATNGMEGVEKARAEAPLLVVCDVVMPKLGGLEVCSIIKSLAAERFLPIILMSTKDDIESRVTGLRIGADDYVVKPFDNRELMARVEALLRIKKAHDEVEAQREKLEALSITDPLTGVFNQRAMQTRLHDEFQRAQRYNESISVLMIDADHFKNVNDEYGHQFGDKVLKELAAIISESVREVDVLARYGGEEFLVILPQTHFTGSLTVAERVWRSVNTHTFSNGQISIKVSVSIGVSFYPNRDVESWEQLVGFADQALYEAKRQGRDRICLHQHLNYVYHPDKDAAPVLKDEASAAEEAEQVEES